MSSCGGGDPHDHATLTLGHLARGGSGGEKVRPNRPADWAFELLVGHLQQRHPMDVAMADRVEGDVDASGSPGNACHVLIHAALIQRIDQRGLGRAACMRDLVGHPLQSRLAAAREKDARTLTSKDARNRAANGAAATIDHRILVFEQHLQPSVEPRVLMEPDHAGAPARLV